jgi:hypothetical protein
MDYLDGLAGFTAGLDHPSGGMGGSRVRVTKGLEVIARLELPVRVVRKSWANQCPRILRPTLLETESRRPEPGCNSN